MATSSAMLDRIALHEAGHAVVARALALHCGGASVADDHGRTTYQDTTDNSIAVLVATMSGAAAEHVLIGNIGNGIAGDQERVRVLTDARGMSQDAIDRLWRVACLLVKVHETDIRVLAVELVRRRQLSGEQIDALAWPRGRPDE
jgi:hypothetical protein